MPNDRRIRRTRKLLHSALATLILARGYRNITIQDVAEHADIGYRTFFRHYASLDDLLLDMVQTVMDELDQRLNIYTPPSGDMRTEMSAKGQALFAYVREHETIFRVLLLDDGARFAIQPLLQRARQRVETALSDLPSNLLPHPVVANHLIISTLALMRWWLEYDFPYENERMGQIFVDLIVQPLQWMYANRETAPNEKPA
ncbi:MAG: TetR/AcrR family transcriptional regulator [Anaerolineales bacterium]